MIFAQALAAAYLSDQVFGGVISYTANSGGLSIQCKQSSFSSNYGLSNVVVRLAAAQYVCRIGAELGRVDATGAMMCCPHVVTVSSA